MENLEFQFKNGHWQWDEEHNTIQFISHDVQMTIEADPPTAKQRHRITSNMIRFKDQIDHFEMLRFRRMFQRRIKLDDIEIITLQDIKDVALFQAFPKDLTIEFVRYFHLPEVDNFLKALIIYFHYFLQVTDAMQLRRVEALKKLRQPIVEINEDKVRDNLADLRAMVSREYSVILMGFGRTASYHHLNTTTNSLAEKDRRLFEALMCMSIRVVWLALQRKNLPVIDLELNRMIRTPMFNTFAHKARFGRSFNRTPSEEKLLFGLANIKETKLKQRSGLIKELLLIRHDYRMLGARIKNYDPKDDRCIYIEKLFSLPYESLMDNNMTIGLIGIPREEYDFDMKPRPRTSTNFDKVVLEPINFNFPPDIPVQYDQIPPAFPKTPCIYTESEATKRSRIVQCHKWVRFLSKFDATSVAATSSEDGDNVQIVSIFNPSKMPKPKSCCQKVLSEDTYAETEQNAITLDRSSSNEQDDDDESCDQCLEEEVSSAVIIQECDCKENPIIASWYNFIKLWIAFIVAISTLFIIIVFIIISWKVLVFLPIETEPGRLVRLKQP